MFISSVRYLCGTYILTEDEHFGSFLFEVSFYTIIRTLSYTIVPNILLCYNYNIVNKMGLVGLILGLENKTMM